ncbi:hypothetical protein PC9H_000629 [Pleurotus ostreatus]|uniref:Uncharacterized protein n=1 Tax=Pleurotus ostreatus TaxID=5322 RepID=A0A8H7DX03_PLEOS|nr:uncharacterized protein PC9H_000629 [Pleurotus ostreatus]KAF7440285.1 hypothetical protein PC9H_000629 [Pleurotus ostreatus]
MPQDEEGRDFGPHNGHLGTSWEIAVIVVFVVLLVAVVSTLIFHVRRKQRRKRQEQYDLERGRREQAEKELNTSAGDRNSRRQSSFANNSAASLPRRLPRTLPSVFARAGRNCPTGLPYIRAIVIFDLASAAAARWWRFSHTRVDKPSECRLPCQDAIYSGAGGLGGIEGQGSKA